MIFLAGTPFITEVPRQGALGGLTPLQNEPAARGCDVQDGDCHQGEHRDLVEFSGIGEFIDDPVQRSRLFRDVPGVSGSTILDDGRVALILDVSTLLRDVIAEQTQAMN